MNPMLRILGNVCTGCRVSIINEKFKNLTAEFYFFFVSIFQKSWFLPLPTLTVSVKNGHLNEQAFLPLSSIFLSKCHFFCKKLYKKDILEKLHNWYNHNPSLQLCHNLPIPINGTIVFQDLCLQIQSFFTWDELNGLNICFMWMIGSSVLFIGILVMIETGIIKRLFSGKSNRVRFSW